MRFPAQAQEQDKHGIAEFRPLSHTKTKLWKQIPISFLGIPVIEDFPYPAENDSAKADKMVTTVTPNEVYLSKRPKPMSSSTTTAQKIIFFFIIMVFKDYLNIV